MKLYLQILILLSALSYCCSKRDGTIQPIIIVTENEEARYTMADYADDYFAKFISDTLRGKEQLSGDPEEKEYFTTYLGKLKIEDQEFHVITQFYSVQEEHEKRGNSRVILMNKELKFEKFYELASPEELPIQVQDSVMIFNIDNKYIGRSYSKVPEVLIIPQPI